MIIVQNPMRSSEACFSMLLVILFTNRTSLNRTIIAYFSRHRFSCLAMNVAQLL